MNKAQTELARRVEALTGLNLNAKPIRSRVIKIDLPDGRPNYSRIAAEIIRACHQYKIARVEPCGVESIALTPL